MNLLRTCHVRDRNILYIKIADIALFNVYAEDKKKVPTKYAESAASSNFSFQ